MMRFLRQLFAGLIVVCGLSASFCAQAETFSVAAGYSVIEFDEAAGVPVRWTICQSVCTEGSERRAVLIDAGDGYVQVATPRESGGNFVAAVESNSEYVSVRFTSTSMSTGESAVTQYVYRISRTQPVIDLELPAGARLKMATGSSFVPDPLPGFGASYTHVRTVQVSGSGQTSIEFDEEDPVSTTDLQADPGGWTGLRSRYWAVLVQPISETLTGATRYSGEDRPVLELATEPGSEPVVLRLYAGPIAWKVMRVVSPALSEMLFAALWDFLRWLCFGMLILLDWLYLLVGNYGVAIILLSLSVKILMSPLSMLADRWQADVNRIHSLLKPELDEIKRSYKGEEAHDRTLAVYKKHDVSMFYTFKSAAGFLIQIPVFIAAFDMLSENAALNEIAFLWVSDLAKTDAFAELPFALPFFGAWLNLLPFLMTALSVLAAWLQSEDTLSPDLQRQQSFRLYLMGAAFFFLFYTFPAGMVLYWTSSNLFHLIKVESLKLFSR